MDTSKQYLSKEKHDELIAEQILLTTERRKEVAKKLEDAKALGDLSENAEYHAAREEQAVLEERINELEEILRTAIIVKEDHGKKDAVGIGSEVVVSRDGKKYSYTLVGSEETDVAAGRISNRSPLGEALMGKKKGDKVNYETPAGKMECSIVSIA